MKQILNKNLMSKIFISVGSFILIFSSLFLFIDGWFIKQFYYCTAWWSFIFLIDGVNYRIKKESLIISTPIEFVKIVFWSIGFWFFFEFINLHIKNWIYVSIPYEKWIRYPAYLLAYSTVLPGIFEVKNLLDNLNFFKDFKTKGFVLTQRKINVFFYTGVISVLLFLIFPKIFFPLVWGFVVFLIDPINLKNNRDSILKEWSEGCFTNTIRLLLSGLICGVLWEYWNFWAGAKWKYIIPLPDILNFKLFEMPLLGYLGFPPFALECFIFYTFIKNTSPTNKILKYILFSLAVSFWFVVICGIDNFTVKSWIYLKKFI